MARNNLSRRYHGCRGVSLIALILATAACQDSPTGPDGQRAANQVQPPEIAMRVGADYAEQGDVLSLELRIPAVAYDLRARLTWDPHRFELIQDDLDAEWLGRDLDRGELLLAIGGAQGRVELRFRALATGETSGFGVESQGFYGGGDGSDADAVVI